MHLLFLLLLFTIYHLLQGFFFNLEVLQFVIRPKEDIKKEDVNTQYLGLLNISDVVSGHKGHYSEHCL